MSVFGKVHAVCFLQQEKGLVMHIIGFFASVLCPACVVQHYSQGVSLNNKQNVSAQNKYGKEVVKFTGNMTSFSPNFF